MPRIDGEEAWRDHVAGLGPDDLRQLVDSMPVIEQAKGVLMAHFHCDASTAFALLRRVSSQRNLKLRSVAAIVVSSASLSTPRLRAALGASPRTSSRTNGSS